MENQGLKMLALHEYIGVNKDDLVVRIHVARLY